MNEKDILFDLLKKGVSPIHTVEACAERLREAGFAELSCGGEWNLVPGGRYYIRHHNTTLFAFTNPKEARQMEKQEGPAVRIAAAHTDFPCLRIKPAAARRSPV